MLNNIMKRKQSEEELLGMLVDRLKHNYSLYREKFIEGSIKEQAINKNDLAEYIVPALKDVLNAEIYMDTNNAISIDFLNAGRFKLTIERD